jgi:hypothetical protein
MASTSEPPPVTTWPIAAVPEGAGELVQREVFPGFDNLPSFDIRNGDASTATSILVRPTIPVSYHWVPLGGIDPIDATQAIDGYIKSALVQLENNPPPSMTAAQRRKAAIAVGTARATITAFYRLLPGDIIGGELNSTYMNATKQANGTIAYNVVAPNNMPNRALLTAPLNTTDVEKAAIAVLMSSTIGILPVQGFSLMMTGHHYLSEANNQSRKAFAVIERQFWKSAVVADWFNSDLQMLQDCCWHKAGHPVSITLKENLAIDDKVATMLREAGAGSAASRLPALESALRAAGSYQTLMSTVDPLFRMFGGKMEIGTLPLIVDFIKAWPKTKHIIDTPTVFPETVTTRAQAISWLNDILSRNSAKVAYCYGFYCALSEQNMMLSGTGQTDTLKTSFSLQKLKGQSMAAYVEGALSYNDFSAARAQRRQAGSYAPPSFDFETSVVAQ